MVNDVLIRGGRVIDPAAGRDEMADVLARDGRIEAIGPGIEAPPDAQVVDATGLLVTPGLIDLHVHVYPGLGDFCLHPDRVGVESGVPTVVDAGTSGAATFGLARKWIDDPEVRTQILALVDPCQIYFATKDFVCHKLEIANDLRNLDVDLAASIVEGNADVVVGMKVRACSVDDPHVSPFLEAAKQVAGPRPIMVHLGRFPFTATIPTADLLRALRPGDVITHAFRGASGMLDSDALASADLRDAVERGVQLDVGHSGTDFRFATARTLFDQGYLPTTISTDLNVFNVDHPVISLAQTMTKIWALGVPLDGVIAMTTCNPARVIHREDTLGTLAPGRVANVSVLRIDDGEFELSDGYETMNVAQRLAPVGCVRGSLDPGRVKPAPFDYVRPTGVGEAIELLRDDDGAKVIAGGQSLVPLMAMRLARPTLLVDVNDLPLDNVAVDGDVVRIGAMTRHSRLERDPVVLGAAPVLAEAASLIGHPAIRTRGTLGGSLAHADPLAELPAALVAAGGAVVARGPGGDRTIAAADLFAGFLTTTLEPDELLVEVTLPAAGPRHGAAFCEWAPRDGDFAVAGIAVIIERSPAGECATARGAVIGTGSVPLDCSDLIAGVVGAVAADDALLRDVARRVRGGVGGDEDRSELVGLLAARAVLRAFERSSAKAVAA